MKRKILFNKEKRNTEPRIFFLAGFAFLVNIAFFAYNLVFGIAYHLVWNWSISIYYALLIFLRAVILFCEQIWRKKQEATLDKKRLRLFQTINWCMLILDFSLIAPIALMVLSKREMRYGTIPTIAMAAYTTYKVTLAVVNFTKKKSKCNLSVRALRQITLKDSIVSVLTLQNAMLMQFSKDASTFTLAAWTSGGLWLLLLFITLSSLFVKPKTT